MGSATALPDALEWQQEVKKDSATPPATQKDQAAEQLKQEERQRILGVMPNFNSTDNQNAHPTPMDSIALYGEMRSFLRCCTKTRVTSARKPGVS